MWFAKRKSPPIRSLVAEGTRLEGTLHFADGLRLDGGVVGDIRAEGDRPTLLVISETAEVTGQVHADHVIINGKVNGPVFARQMLELQPKANIVGDVHYRALEMHQGAMITGQMHPAAAVAEDKPTLKLAANNQ